MKQIFEYLDKIENVSGTNEKKTLLYTLLKIEPEAEELIKLAFDRTVYGVSSRSFEKICNHCESDGYYFDVGELCFDKSENIYEMNLSSLKNFLDKIKIKTGLDKLSELRSVLDFSKIESKWIARIIIKDLKLGLSVKSVNEVLSNLGKNKIEVFEVQLCDKFDDMRYTDISNDIREKVGYPCGVSIKYDGMRGFLQKINSSVVFTSRNGEIIDYVPELIESFSKIEYDFILDGEILCDNFSLLQARIGRKIENIEPIKSLHFRIFDILNFNGKDLSKELQYIRNDYLRKLQSLFDRNQCLYKFEESITANSYEEIKNFYLKAVERKEEGIIIKKLNVPYDYGSRKNWFKVKPIMENSFIIVDRKYGTGKKASVISSLNVTDQSKSITSWVGSGLTDSDILNIMYLDRDNKLIGSIVDIQYNEIMTDKFGSKSLRFPRFLKIRSDKKEADDLSENKND